VTTRTTTARKRPRLRSKGPTLLAFPVRPGPPRSPHLSAETHGCYLKPFSKLQAACYSRGTMCERGCGKMPGISALRLRRGLADAPALSAHPQAGLCSAARAVSVGRGGSATPAPRTAPARAAPGERFGSYQLVNVCAVDSCGALPGSPGRVQRLLLPLVPSLPQGVHGCALLAAGRPSGSH